ncbi:MAG TPA: hypothetical protein VFE92_12785 [Dermatophilaceae bacterium]|nr:hypothetical protein [Dermatophilaceae bacterium]
MNVPTVVIALKAAVSKAVGNEVDKVLAVALNVARQEAHAWSE